MEPTSAEAPLTVGALCAAISEGRIAYRIREGRYEVPAPELRRLQREDTVLDSRPMPTRPPRDRFSADA